jgi:F0F1-type ATP synthase assembly protein I
MNEDELDRFIDSKVDVLKKRLNKEVDRLHAVIRKHKPQKPDRSACSSDEEFAEKEAQYEEEVQLFSEFVSYAVSILGRIVDFIAQICNSVIALFQKLWTWLVEKVTNIATKVYEAVAFIKEQFDRFWAAVFS